MSASLSEFAGLSLPPITWWTRQPGLTHFPSGDGQAYVAYRVLDGCAITLGEPIGARQSIPGLIQDFHRWCERGGLRPCWWHVTPAWLEQLKAGGQRAAQIGEYAMVDLAGFDLRGGHWRDARAARRRLLGAGFSADWYDLAADPDALFASLEGISRDWLSRRRLPELRHSLGSFHGAFRSGAGLRCLLLRDGRGAPAAFMTFAPLYRSGGGYGLDMLRGAAGLPRDSMLSLLSTALLSFKDEGLPVASLGLAPLWAPPRPAPLGGGRAGEDTPRSLRALRGLAWVRSRSAYNFRGLAFFKQRFATSWEPRYLVYPSLGELPRTMRALCHAHGLRARVLWRVLWG